MKDPEKLLINFLFLFLNASSLHMTSPLGINHMRILDPSVQQLQVNRTIEDYMLHFKIQGLRVCFGVLLLLLLLLF